jgi:hypothetical protein
VGVLQRETVEQQSALEEEDDVDANELRAVHEELGSGESDARRNAVTSKACTQTVRRLKRTLQEEQDVVMSRLRAGEVESVQSALGSIDDQTATYQRSIVRLFREVVRSGAESVESSNVERTIADHAGTAAARELASELVEDLRATLVPAIESVLSTTFDNNSAQSELAQAYRTVKGEHLEQIVEDRIGGAFDQGVALAGQV